MSKNQLIRMAGLSSPIIPKYIIILSVLFVFTFWFNIKAVLLIIFTLRRVTG